MIRFGRDRVAEGIVAAIEKLCDGPSYVMLMFKESSQMTITGCNFKGEPISRNTAKEYNESHQSQLRTIRELAGVLGEHLRGQK